MHRFRFRAVANWRPSRYLRTTVLPLAAAALIVSSGGVATGAGNAHAGARLFSANCARCHGKDAKGDGPDLVKLNADVSPDDWTDKELNRELSDVFIISMITKGGAANGKSRIMPAFSNKLGSQQVQDLLAFMRSLAK